MCVPLHRQEPGRGRCSRVLRQPSPISFFTIPSMLPSASDTRRLLHFQKHLHHPGRKKEVTKETELAKPQTHAHTRKHAHHMHTRTHITQTCTHMHTSHTHTPHTDTHTSHTHAHVTHVHILTPQAQTHTYHTHVLAHIHTLTHRHTLHHNHTHSHTSQMAPITSHWPELCHRATQLKGG